MSKESEKFGKEDMAKLFGDEDMKLEQTQPYPEETAQQKEVPYLELPKREQPQPPKDLRFNPDVLVWRLQEQLAMVPETEEKLFGLLTDTIAFINTSKKQEAYVKPEPKPQFVIQPTRQQQPPAKPKNKKWWEK